VNKRESGKDELRIVAWELTCACNLRCIHCRAAACDMPSPDELTTEECYAVIDDIVSFARPIVILTGGEPLLRDDVFDIAAYGTRKGLRVVMATNGTLLDETTAQRCVDAGIKRISVSLDGVDAEVHDEFRQMPGAFEGSMRGIEAAKKMGLEFQINSSLTMQNLDQLPGLMPLAVDLGAVAHHIFMLVPVGRGENLKGVEIPPDKYEETLNWIYDQREKVPLQIKVTCAPQYYRILRQRAKAEGRTVTRQTDGLDAVTRGCLGGKAFCFISHSGQIQPCGYLELDCGNVRKEGLSVAWRKSKIFHDLRNPSAYEGKCGMCEYKAVCGGCRARAHAKTDNYLAEEPCCVYVPMPKRDES